VSFARAALCCSLVCLMDALKEGSEGYQLEKASRQAAPTIVRAWKEETPIEYITKGKLGRMTD